MGVVADGETVVVDRGFAGAEVEVVSGERMFEGGCMVGGDGLVVVVVVGETTMFPAERRLLNMCDKPRPD